VQITKKKKPKKKFLASKDLPWKTPALAGFSHTNCKASILKITRPSTTMGFFSEVVKF
jgi:hypothetical protein